MTRSTQAIDSIRHKLQSGAAANDEAVDLRWAAGALAGQRQPPPESLRHEVATALVDELVEATDGDALSWLAGLHAAGRLAKLARTGAHRLRTRKVDVELVPGGQHEALAGNAGGAVRSEPGASTAASIATIYDGRDERLVWLVESAATKGLLMAQGRLSSRFGLLDCEIGSLGRKAYRKLVRELKQKVLTVDIDGDTARWLIDDAARRAEQVGRTLPRDYLHLRREFGPRVEGEHPAVAAVDAAEADDAALVALLDHPLLAGWRPQADLLRRLLLRLEEVLTSQLMISEDQRRQQIEHAIDRWLGEYLSTERTRADRLILLDTAHLLLLQGQADEAARALAAARVYELPAERLRSHPFVARFVRRTLPDIEALVHRSAADSADRPPEKVTDGGLVLP